MARRLARCATQAVAHEAVGAGRKLDQGRQVADPAGGADVGGLVLLGWRELWHGGVAARGQAGRAHRARGCSGGHGDGDGDGGAGMSSGRDKQRSARSGGAAGRGRAGARARRARAERDGDGGGCRGMLLGGRRALWPDAKHSRLPSQLAAYVTGDAWHAPSSTPNHQTPGRGQTLDGRHLCLRMDGHRSPFIVASRADPGSLRETSFAVPLLCRERLQVTHENASSQQLPYSTVPACAAAGLSRSPPIPAAERLRCEIELHDLR